MGRAWEWAALMHVNWRDSQELSELAERVEGSELGYGVSASGDYHPKWVLMKPSLLSEP